MPCDPETRLHSDRVDGELAKLLGRALLGGHGKGVQVVDVLIVHEQDGLVALADPLHETGHFRGEWDEVRVVALVEQAFEVLGFVVKFFLDVEFHFVGDEAGCDLLRQLAE